MIESTIRDPILENMVLFVNSISGGQSGKRFIDLEIENIDFTFDKNRVRLSIYDLLNPEAKINGLERVKMESETKKVKVIVCGGDGTVLWVVQEIIKYQIDLNNVVIGIIPIGTGNDFSRATGWGGEQATMIGKKLQKLKQLVRQWMNAIVMQFDIWEIEMSVFENGLFKKGSANGGKIQDRKVIKRCFSNYCSIGIDGRIGYSFDKFRSSSRLANLAIYGGIGIQKSFKSSPPINKIVERMYIETPIGGNKSFNSDKKSFPSLIQPQLQSKIVQKQVLNQDKDKQIKRTTIQSNAQNSDKINQDFIETTVFSNIQPKEELEVDLLNITALNIQSYMGGVSNIWNKSEPASKKRKNIKLTPSSANDGLIQIVGWKGETGLALQRFFNMAYKVQQGQGPFHFQFKHQHLTQPLHTYLQIDGQFWKVISPKQMIIRKAQMIPGHRIHVLHKR